MIAHETVYCTVFVVLEIVSVKLVQVAASQVNALESIKILNGCRLKPFHGTFDFDRKNLDQSLPYA